MVTTALHLGTTKPALAGAAFEILNDQPYRPEYLFAWDLFQLRKQLVQVKILVSVVLSY